MELPRKKADPEPLNPVQYHHSALYLRAVVNHRK
jgi:hypothetical protein